MSDSKTLERLLVLETTAKVWGIDPDKLNAIADLDGSVITAQLAEDLSAAVAATNPRAPKSTGKIAVIPVQGMITPSPSLFAMLFGGGGGGLTSLRANLSQAAADPEISAIVMDFDSPGGYVDMIPETAAAIRTARVAKPVVSVSNTTMGSAAYWLGSQASEMVASPSSETGSIGVYKIHQDQSERLALAGVKPTIVKAGKYKIEANPYSPLSDEAQAAWQKSVNNYYDMFTADVAKGRGVMQSDVQSGYGEGRMLNAKDAKSAGLVDRVDTLDATIKRLAHPGALAALRKQDGAALGFDIDDADANMRKLVEALEDFPTGKTRDEQFAAMSPEEKDRALDLMLAGFGYTIPERGLPA